MDREQKKPREKQISKKNIGGGGISRAKKEVGVTQKIAGTNYPKTQTTGWKEQERTGMKKINKQRPGRGFGGEHKPWEVSL